MNYTTYKNGKRWTKEDESFLKECGKEGLTNVEISQLMNRSYNAVTIAKNRLGLSEKRKKTRRWTAEEEVELIEMYYEGYNDKEIANVLKRTKKAIKARRNELRLVSQRGRISGDEGIYAIYKEEEFLTEGTMSEIADELGVTLTTVKRYEWKTRNDKHAKTIVIRID